MGTLSKDTPEIGDLTEFQLYINTLYLPSEIKYTSLIRVIVYVRQICPSVLQTFHFSESLSIFYVVYIIAFQLPLLELRSLVPADLSH